MTIAAPATITVDRTGIQVAGIPTLAAWSAEFQRQLDAKDGSAWALGDLLNFAEDEAPYGEDYAQVLDGRRISEGALANYASLARRFPRTERVYNLSHSHYAAVAKLAKADRARAHDLLRKAESTDMNRDELRAAAKKALNEPEPVKPLKVCGRIEAHGESITLHDLLPEGWAGLEVEITVRMKAA